MTDFVSKEKRSKIMSSIKSKNTTIDNKVAGLLSNAGIKFKRYPNMAGNPDFILEGSKVAIFCDGDFWHGHYHEKRKKELSKFWRDKIKTNMERDKTHNMLLRKTDWKVIRLWENDIILKPKKCLRKIISAFR